MTGGESRGGEVGGKGFCLTSDETDNMRYFKDGYSQFIVEV